VAYLLLFLAVVFENALPAFAPPTWTILVFAYAKFDLNIYLTVLSGVMGATLGRAILTHYINWFSHKIFNEEQHKNLGYLGNKFGHTASRNFIFIFLYCLTPLSTTALFVAAGMAKIKIRFILLGFFFGRLVSYTVLVLSTKALSANISDISKGILSWKSILSSVVAISILLLFIFIDWAKLFEEKKLRLNFKVWKWSKQKTLKS
jgi:membrane protein YqaA with SNARE-associated domain